MQNVHFVVDFGQNMEMPCFGGNQPGDIYYFTPLSVYNLGAVNCAHVHEGETDAKNQMHCRVHHEGIASKEATNVTSLILKTLTDANINYETGKGGDLNIVFDNYSGQNKNNTGLRLIPYLVKLGYFKAVNFIFLVVGHTKNSTDMLFNVLKLIYRDKDSHLMEELFENLHHSKRVTVCSLSYHDDFLKKFYSNITRKIKPNHIFYIDEIARPQQSRW